ncbi:CDK2-associated and cullin domain-containing protein 1-like isoform X4 [Polyodon spathula]|uniref:CDK2-associated and cullin domain-containing protein 1-like isoform X4 n=1 Tax=Polyodon spathula TaxID=7913 RepID=UPI001B7EE6F1|nr:CDK2-associated and cullin domain-containing protein 1-like isoform X4 [Polyodon spathula]
MDESMDEDGGVEMMDDHNHNNWEASADAYRQNPPNPHQQTGHAGHSTECEAEGSAQPSSGAHSLTEPGNGVGDSAGTGASAAAAGKVTLNINSSTSKFLMNIITTEDYKSTYWPKLESAIEQLLTQNPQDYIPISYEQIYSCVYKCVCQQHSEQMYNDLIHKITVHLQHISQELENKFYIETKLNRDLKEDLTKLFTDYVAEKHMCTLMPLLIEAHSTPFQITPSTMANIVKGLYTLRPEWAQLAPTLFSNFIPNILPPALESELSVYAAQDQKLQRELMQNGFTRGDQSRKRAGEELAYNGSLSSCATSRGYR